MIPELYELVLPLYYRVRIFDFLLENCGMTPLKNAAS
jgi:hypothetical protein